MTPRKLVAGNWKMHGTSETLADLREIAAGAARAAQVDVAICVPATLIERAVRAAPGFAIGAQDVHCNPKGAHTGCVACDMLLDAGARLTIVGHSERRDAQRESDAEVRAKANAALKSGLDVILCVGESLDVREQGRAVPTVETQLDSSLPANLPAAERLAIAYEPIWAIGTGKVPTASEIGEMHAALRARLVAAFGNDGQAVRILYGGSVKGSNAPEIFAIPDVDGALVGGASLKAGDFLPIVEAAAAVEAAPRFA